MLTYWLKADNATACRYFIGLGFISLLIPARWLQISNNPGIYVELGVRFIRKFVQNGDYFKSKKPVIQNKTGAISYQRTIVMYERYHFLCFVFFLATTVHAAIYRQYAMAALLMVANIVYNVCPILLQQYNYVRLFIIKKSRL